MEVEKRTNRASIDLKVCVLPLNSFVLEPDYADIAKRLLLMSQPLLHLKLLQALVKSLDAVLFVHKGTIANQK